MILKNYNYFNFTEVQIEDNLPNDHYCVYDNYYVSFNVHLKIVNLNPKVEIKNCKVYLEPQNIGGQQIQTQKSFVFSDTQNNDKENFSDAHYIDFAK